jgi:hypothetical protein
VETFQPSRQELLVVLKCLVEVSVGKYLQVVVVLWFGWYRLGRRAVLGADF